MRILYAIYIIFIGLPIFLVSTLLTALITIIFSALFGAHTWGYYPGKVWSHVVCGSLLLPVRIQGREHIREHVSYVFVANHQGAFDIWLIYGYLNRNFKWMMKKSLRKIPFVGKACESAGHVYVDNSGPKKVMETIQKAKSSLRDGVSLVVFPEGSRTPDGHLHRFKRGAFQMADDLGLEVVPITINGSFDVLSRNARWLTWHPLSVTIHRPIAPQGQGQDNIRHFMEASYQAIESGLDEKYRDSQS